VKENLTRCLSPCESYTDTFDTIGLPPGLENDFKFLSHESIAVPFESVAVKEISATLTVDVAEGIITNFPEAGSIETDCENGSLSFIFARNSSIVVTPENLTEVG